MYTITFSVPTLEILTRLADAVKAVTTEKKAPESAPEQTVKADTKVKAEVKSAPQAEAKQEIPKFLSKKDHPDEKELFEKVKELTTHIAVKIDRDVAVATLSQFGAAKATSLKPENYAAYIKAAQAVIDNSTKNAELI